MCRVCRIEAVMEGEVLRRQVDESQLQLEY